MSSDSSTETICETIESGSNKQLDFYEEVSEQRDNIRQLLETGKRDDAGFLLGDQPSLTQDQIKWLVLRMGLRTDNDADNAAEVDPYDRKIWRKNPEFNAVYDICMKNKREAFKLLGTQLLPKVLERIMWLLDSSKGRDVVAGATLLLRSQALLIDRVNKVDRDTIGQLIASLREERPMNVLTVEGEYKEVKDEPN